MAFTKHTSKTTDRQLSWDKTFNEQMSKYGGFPYSGKEFERIDEAQDLLLKSIRSGTDEEFNDCLAHWRRCSTPLPALVDNIASDDMTGWTLCCSELAERTGELAEIRINRCVAFHGMSLVVHTLRDFDGAFMPASVEALAAPTLESRDWMQRLKNKQYVQEEPRAQDVYAPATEVHIRISELPALCAFVSALPGHLVDRNVLRMIDAVKRNFGGRLVRFVSAQEVNCADFLAGAPEDVREKLRAELNAEKNYAGQ